jgi:hypothetical protein
MFSRMSYLAKRRSQDFHCGALAFPGVGWSGAANALSVLGPNGSLRNR